MLSLTVWTRMGSLMESAEVLSEHVGKGSETAGSSIRLWRGLQQAAVFHLTLSS